MITWFAQFALTGFIFESKFRSGKAWQYEVPLSSKPGLCALHVYAKAVYSVA